MLGRNEVILLTSDSDSSDGEDNDAAAAANGDDGDDEKENDVFDDDNRQHCLSGVGGIKLFLLLTPKKKVFLANYILMYCCHHPSFRNPGIFSMKCHP